MLNNLKGKFGLAGMMIALFVMLLGDSAQAEEAYFQLEHEKDTYAIGELIKIKVNGNLDNIYGCELAVSYPKDKVSFAEVENASLNGVSSYNIDAENSEVYYIYSQVGETAAGVQAGEEWGEFIFSAVKEGKVSIAVQLLKSIDVDYKLIEPENAVVVCEIEITRETETETPVPSEKPAETEKPVPSEKPAETEKPVPSEKPAETGTPVPSEKPAETGKPVPSERPAGTEKPVPSERPGGTERPNPSERPSETGIPGPSEKPAGTEISGPGEKPGETESTNEPMITESPVPTNTALDSADGQETVESPQTGDPFKIGTMILLCLLSAGGMTIARIFKK